MAAAFRLTERDGEVLLSVYKHRFLTVSQIQKLHFPSMQTAYRRIRMLRGHELLSEFNVPNIDEAIIMVARKGLVEIAGLLGVEQSSLRWTETKQRPRDYYFMRHFLAINDFRIKLTLECGEAGVRLLGFIPDYYGQRTLAGGTQKYIKDVVCDIAQENTEISHTPDGVFALERDEKKALFFLEIDRGTEVISSGDNGVLKALKFYTQYLIQGKYQRFAQDFGTDRFKGFRALFVTTSNSRIANIRASASAAGLNENALGFIWLSTFDKTNSEGILASSWESARALNQSSYSILGT